MNYISIAADKTQGGVYCVEMPENLYYSGNYGYSNSWNFRNGEVTDNINSRVIDGSIFSGCVLHSEDYGVNFTYHSLNGFFGNPKNVTIDNVDDNIGYVLVFKISVPDTLYLFKTNNKFEDVEIVQKLNCPNGMLFCLSRGNDGGEIFLYYKSSNILNFSSDYAGNFNVIDKFNFNDFYTFDVIGGRQESEVFILYNFVNLMWQNAHIYIFHSTDYGKTFEVFHPFAKGNEPVLANFSTIEKQVHITTPVEFSNFSIGDVQEYQWDFENDGIVDSYELSPIYTFQDTGCYSVKLTVVGPDSSNTFLKEDYIHVYKTVGLKESTPIAFRCYPNPASGKVIIEFSNHSSENEIKIYNSIGKIIRSLKTDPIRNRLLWDVKDNNGNKCKPGIYYIKINVTTQQLFEILST